MPDLRKEAEEEDSLAGKGEVEIGVEIRQSRESTSSTASECRSFRSTQHLPHPPRPPI